jgi:hypothetical protein
MCAYSGLLSVDEGTTRLGSSSVAIIAILISLHRFAGDKSCEIAWAGAIVRSSCSHHGPRTRLTW